MNPMMNQFGAMNLPPVEKLWADEKAKYRSFIVLFGVVLLIVFSLFLISSILNWISSDSIIALISEEIKNDNSSLTDAEILTRATDRYRLLYIFRPLFFLVLIFFSITMYITTIFISYKRKSFQYISIWPTAVIGVLSLFALFDIFSLFWNGGFPSVASGAPGNLYLFINQFIVIVGYVLASSKVTRIRRIFLSSARMEKMKKDPNYQAMMNQFGGGNGSTSSYGPFSGGRTDTNTNSEQKTGAGKQKPNNSGASISKERASLEAMSVADLRKVAGKLMISGAENMNKSELISNILRVTSNK